MQTVYQRWASVFIDDKFLQNLTDNLNILERFWSKYHFVLLFSMIQMYDICNALYPCPCLSRKLVGLIRLWITTFECNSLRYNIQCFLFVNLVPPAPGPTFASGSKSIMIINHIKNTYSWKLNDCLWEDFLEFDRVEIEYESWSICSTQTETQCKWYCYRHRLYSLLYTILYTSHVVIFCIL